MKLNMTEGRPAETDKASDVDFSNLETELMDHVIKREVSMCLLLSFESLLHRRPEA